MGNSLRRDLKNAPIEDLKKKMIDVSDKKKEEIINKEYDDGKYIIHYIVTERPEFLATFCDAYKGHQPYCLRDYDNKRPMFYAIPDIEKVKALYNISASIILTDEVQQAYNLNAHECMNYFIMECNCVSQCDRRLTEQIFEKYENLRPTIINKCVVQEQLVAQFIKSVENSPKILVDLVNNNQKNTEDIINSILDLPTCSSDVLTVIYNKLKTSYGYSHRDKLEPNIDLQKLINHKNLSQNCFQHLIVKCKSVLSRENIYHIIKHNFCDENILISLASRMDYDHYDIQNRVSLILVSPKVTDKVKLVIIDGITRTLKPNSYVSNGILGHIRTLVPTLLLNDDILTKIIKYAYKKKDYNMMKMCIDHASFKEEVLIKTFDMELINFVKQTMLKKNDDSRSVASTAFTAPPPVNPNMNRFINDSVSCAQY